MWKKYVEKIQTADNGLFHSGIKINKGGKVMNSLK